jgi:hypothetical protein
VLIGESLQALLLLLYQDRRQAEMIDEVGRVDFGFAVAWAGRATALAWGRDRDRGPGFGFASVEAWW